MQTLKPRNAKTYPFTLAMGSHGPAGGMASFEMQLDDPLGETHADLDTAISPYRSGTANIALLIRKTATVTDPDPDDTIFDLVRGGDITLTDTLFITTVILYNCTRIGGGVQQLGTAGKLVEVTVRFVDFKCGSDDIQTAANNLASGWEFGNY